MPLILAHSTIPGAGPFLSGFLHPLLTPAHALILISSGLYLGQREGQAFRYGVLGYGPAVAIGLVCAHASFVVPLPILAAVAFSMGMLVLTTFRLPCWLVALFFAGAGFFIGLDSAVDAAAKPGEAFATLLGTAFSLCMVLNAIIYYTQQLPRWKWIEIGIRVVGSWIAAISLLMLAFALRK